MSFYNYTHFESVKSKMHHNIKLVESQVDNFTFDLTGQIDCSQNEGTLKLLYNAALRLYV